MTTRTRARRSYRKRGGRYNWSTFTIDPVSLAQDAQSVAELSVDIANDVKGGAVVQRVVGSWAIKSLTSDTDVSVIASLYMWPGEAFRALELPESQAEEYKPLYWATTIDRVGDTLSGDNKWNQIPVDIKVARKFRGVDDILVWQFENTSASADSVQTYLAVRLLLWVP